MSYFADYSSFSLDEPKNDGFLRRKRVVGYKLNNMGVGGALPLDKVQRPRSTLITATEHECLLEEILKEAETKNVQNTDEKQEEKKQESVDPANCSIQDLKLPQNVEETLKKMGINEIKRPKQYVPIQRSNTYAEKLTKRKNRLSIRMLLYKGHT